MQESHKNSYNASAGEAYWKVPDGGTNVDMAVMNSNEAVRQSCSQTPRGFFWLAPRNRDLWEKSEGEPALVTAVTFSAVVQTYRAVERERKHETDK